MNGRYRAHFEGGPDLHVGTYAECHFFSRNYQLPKGTNQLPTISLIEPMITALAPLGKTHSIQILPDFDGEQATVTVLLKPKDSKKSDNVIPLQFSGTLAEVDQALAEQLPLAVSKIVEHGNAIAVLDKQLEDERKEKEKSVAKEKAKPAAKPATTKAAPAKKLNKAEKKAEATRKRLATMAAKKAAAPAKPGTTLTSLKKAPTAAAPELPLEPAATKPKADDVDFGALFPDDAPAPAAAT